jgi:hypothetical protein
VGQGSQVRGHQRGLSRKKTTTRYSVTAVDRDRGEPRGSTPPTPPGIRVRTAAVREVALTRFDQGGETERFEVVIGQPDGKGFAPGDVPWATAAVGRIAQLPIDPVAAAKKPNQQTLSGSRSYAGMHTKKSVGRIR